MTEPIDARLAGMLDAFTVPELPADFADRVLARAMAEPVGGTLATRNSSRNGPRRKRWRRAVAVGTGLLAAGMISVSAAAMGYLGEPIRQVVSHAIHHVPVVDHALHRILPHHATRLSHRGDGRPVKEPLGPVRGEVASVNPAAAPMFVSPVGDRTVVVGRPYPFGGAPSVRARIRVALELRHRRQMAQAMAEPRAPHFAMRRPEAVAIAGVDHPRQPLLVPAITPSVAATTPSRAVGSNMLGLRPARIGAYQTLPPEEQAARRQQRQQWLIQHPQERQQWLAQHPGWNRWWARHGAGASVQQPGERKAGQEQPATVGKAGAEEGGVATGPLQGQVGRAREDVARGGQRPHAQQAETRPARRHWRGPLLRRRRIG